MPAKNIYHGAVVAALKADGWTITDDPLTLTVGDRNLFIDLGAERTELAAEKGASGSPSRCSPSRACPPSPISRRRSVSTCCTGRSCPGSSRTARSSWRCRGRVYDGILSEPLGRMVMIDRSARVLVFDPDRREVVRWIS